MGEKTASTGHFQIPTAPVALTAVAQNAAANTLGSAVSFGNAPSAMYITGVFIGAATTQTPTYVQIQILVAAAIVGSVLVPYGTSSAAASSVATGFRPVWPPIPVASGAAITVKSASSVASAVNWGVSLECIAQANVVDDGIAQSSNVTQWLGTAAATPATAGIPDVNVKNINNAAAATPGAANGILISGSNSGTTTFGALTVTGATTHTGNVVFSDGITVSAPSTGNRAGLSITGNGTGAGIITTGGATGIGFSIVGGGTSGDGIKVTTTSGHGMNLAPVGSNVHGIFATGGNGGTSDGIKAAAGTGGVDIRGNITGNVTGNLSGSAGSVTGAVGSVTGAVASVTGNVGGNVVGSVASVTGAVGSVTGLTASNLDATISSRMASYTQPTGFLAATFPAGTVANTTNITAGTITTATNLTNAPTAGDFTAAMKTSLNAATPASVTGAVGSVTGNVGGNVVGSVASVTAGVTVTTNNDKTGYALTAGYDLAKTAAQAGDAMTLTAAYNAAKTASQAGDAMALTGAERTTLAGVVNTTAIVEAYRANGAAPTPAQFMSEVLAHLGEAAIVGTTKTINKLDHSTAAQTFTLDSATAPSTITRAT